MSSSKPIDTPSAANIHLTAMFAPQSEEEKEYMSRVPYASAVGSLMYAMVCTRPDSAHAVSVVSRFMGQPGREHWQAVKRIFRYLRGTSDVGLIYGGDTQCLVTGYSDSDYAGDVDTRRSMTGYVFTLGGSVVSWKATLQPTVTLSTTEAEYMALTEAAKEGIWLKGLTKITNQPFQPNPFFCSLCQGHVLRFRSRQSHCRLQSCLPTDNRSSKGKHISSHRSSCVHISSIVRIRIASNQALSITSINETNVRCTSKLSTYHLHKAPDR
uniref:Reverse transcriptase Ty1/copia-type domain-containing protein n=1 Tax=Solanum lycopersicum TaxID=4081 RepID=A0A3Q7GI83_SOLLC